VAFAIDAQAVPAMLSGVPEMVQRCQ